MRRGCDLDLHSTIVNSQLKNNPIAYLVTVSRIQKAHDIVLLVILVG